MKLTHLLQAYSFDELMPVINEMFPGTSKFRPQLEAAYDIMVSMRPVPSKKTIRFQTLHDEKGSLSYLGAEDSCFDATWEVCLGKEVTREGGVDLSNIELAANCLVNLCLLGHYPKTFESAHQQLMKG
ncbi:hypothetical protein [Prevotella sp. KH2C16]|uniref:hypothetical protein n=1 Tax=Prevotella sp. KH2C16 TaxID=1855325 RepID=UPI0008F05A78|nr:hypothetical protein [Prevotella sp. KH2C16]SFG15762.1 hypothetical protein SAMN05216383_10631 [Prevotella sp. KH2C16]